MPSRASQGEGLTLFQSTIIIHRSINGHGQWLRMPCLSIDDHTSVYTRYWRGSAVMVSGLLGFEEELELVERTQRHL